MARQLDCPGGTAAGKIDDSRIRPRFDQMVHSPEAGSDIYGKHGIKQCGFFHLVRTCLMIFNRIPVHIKIKEFQKLSGIFISVS